MKFMSVSRLGGREDDCPADLKEKKESTFTCGYIVSVSISLIFHLSLFMLKLKANLLVDSDFLINFKL